MSIVIGDCNQHSRSAEMVVQIYDNITKVADWHCAPAMGGIAPYSRPFAITGLPSCAGGNPLSDDCNGDCDKIKCGPWPLDERVANSWSGSPTGTTSLGGCKKIGFKNVQAKKSWHGMFGFMEWDYATCALGTTNPLGAPMGCSCVAAFQPEVGTPPSTKYLTMDVVMTETITSAGDPSLNGTATKRRVVTINKNSGVQTLAGAGYHDPTIEPPDPGDPWPPFSSACIDPDAETFVGSDVNGQWSGPPSPIGVLVPTKADISNIAQSAYAELVAAATAVGLTVATTNTESGTFWRNGSIDYDDGFGNPDSTQHVDWDVDLGTFNFTNAGLSCSISISNTHSHWTFSEPDSGGPHDFGRTLTVDAYLSDSYSSTDLYADVMGLLVQIDMADDLRYPWRTDAYTSVAPLVSRNEALPKVPSIAVDCDYVDSDAARYDGAIKGLLLDSAGKDGYFDYDHENWAACGPPDTACAPYIKSYGAFSARAGDDPCAQFMPRTATQWTNNYEGSFLPHGAWVGMLGNSGGFSGIEVFGFGHDVAAAQKYAECRVLRPAFNMNRPCSDRDKYAIDETSVRCVTAFDGTNITVTDAPPGGYSKVAICGVSGLASGVYNVTGSGTSYVLGSLVEAKSFADCGTGFIGQLRHPAGVSADCGGDFYLPPQGKYTYATWTHSFRDFVERDRVINQYTACGCAASAPGSTTPLRTHQADWGMPRSVQQFGAFGGVIGLNNCGPTVFAIVPSDDFGYSETWAGGAISTLPGVIDFDSRYGTLYQAEHVQHLIDPLWQVPHRICVDCGDFGKQFSLTPHAEDCGAPGDSNCPDDNEGDPCDPLPGDVVYYSHAPMVEASLAPAGPFNVLVLPDLDTSSAPDGTVLPPPPIRGYPLCTAVPKTDSDLPWVLYLCERSCSCGNDRWMDEYLENMAGCGT